VLKKILFQAAKAAKTVKYGSNVDGETRKYLNE
jgi:hypothetical protein